MRINYIHQYFNTPAMVGGTRSFEMAKRLVANGHVVNMITSWRGSDRGSDWFQTEECGVNVYWLPVPYSNHMSYYERIKAFFYFAFKSAHKLASLKADIIFATSTPLTIALPAVYASKRNKIPMVFEVRDLWPQMPIALGVLKNPFFKIAAKTLERWAYKNSSAIIALSPGMKQGVLESGYSESKVAVIPNSSDNQDFKYNSLQAKKFRVDREWLSDKPLLIYAGTFGRVNGVAYVVKLAKCLLLIESNIKILLVGDGAERNILIKQARDNGVYGVNLFFEQQMSKLEMPALFSACTVGSNLVIDLPEARANSANKFFDTLAAGKPIFLNHGGWMHELVNQHDCGITAWGRSIQVVACELHQKMNDAAWLLKAGVSAKRLATDYFDRDVLAKQLEQVLVAAFAGNPEIASKIAPGIYE